MRCSFRWVAAVSASDGTDALAARAESGRFPPPAAVIVTSSRDLQGFFLQPAVALRRYFLTGTEQADEPFRIRLAINIVFAEN